MECGHEEDAIQTFLGRQPGQPTLDLFAYGCRRTELSNLRVRKDERCPASHDRRDDRVGVNDERVGKPRNRAEPLSRSRPSSYGLPELARPDGGTQLGARHRGYPARPKAQKSPLEFHPE